MTNPPSTPARLIGEPITGREDLGDVREPRQALAQFYRALNSRDLVLLAENWEQSSDAAMDNPLGGIKRGWDEIRAVYERIFRGPARLRTTRIFRRAGDGWRQVHHHGSIEDPALLAAYQQAVR